jgi:putative transposase
MQGSDARKLKSLEDENARLKRMVANMALENEAMKDLIHKKVLTVNEKR